MVSLNFNNLLKTLYPNAFTLGIRASAHTFEGHDSVHRTSEETITTDSWFFLQTSLLLLSSSPQHCSFPYPTFQ